MGFGKRVHALPLANAGPARVRGRYVPDPEAIVEMEKATAQACDRGESRAQAMGTHQKQACAGEGTIAVHGAWRAATGGTGDGRCYMRVKRRRVAPDLSP